MGKSKYNREIEDLAETIEKSRKLGYKINLLIGAGCSISAGIPSADNFVKQIAKEYPREYKRCKTKKYGECMARLTPTERRNLISEYVSGAKINWAHLCIAQLIKNKYIDRVLTTNFDNLLVKACAVVQEYPAIYDLTSCSGFRTDLMLDGAIVYLHGQYNGFILCNTESEVDIQKTNIESIFHELNRRSIWIIVGYSGENDAIRDLLASQDVNENRLFWVGYNDNKPSTIVEKKILSEERYSFFISGYDGDEFFIELTKQLECFPPKIIDQPFTYLEGVIDSIQEYKNKKTFGDQKINIHTKNVVNKAVELLENNPLIMAEHYLKIGMFNKVTELLENNSKSNDDILERFNDYFKVRINECKEYINEQDKEDNYKNRQVILNLIDAYNLLILIDCNEKEEVVICYKKIDGLFEKLFLIEENTSILDEWIKKLIGLANLYQLDSEEALKCLIKAEDKIKISMKMNENNTEIQISLGKLYKDLYSLYTQNGDTETAQEYYKKAIEIFSNLNSKDSYNINLLVNWAELLIDNIDVESESAMLILKQAISKYEYAYNFKEDITIKAACYYQLINLLENNIENDILLKHIFDNVEEIILEISLNDEAIILIFEQLMKLCRIKFKHRTKFLKRLWISNRENIMSSKCKKKFELYNEWAYYLIEDNEFELSKELIDLSENKENEEYRYLATKGLWYYRNIEIDLKECQDKGEMYYDECIKKYTDIDDLVNTKIITQKKLLEQSKFWYNRNKNTVKCKEIINSTSPEFCREKGFISIYKEIEELKDEIKNKEEVI